MWQLYDVEICKLCVLHSVIYSLSLCKNAVDGNLPNVKNTSEAGLRKARLYLCKLLKRNGEARQDYRQREQCNFTFKQLKGRPQPCEQSLNVYIDIHTDKPTWNEKYTHFLKEYLAAKK